MEKRKRWGKESEDSPWRNVGVVEEQGGLPPCGSDQYESISHTAVQQKRRFAKGSFVLGMSRVRAPSLPRPTTRALKGLETNQQRRNPLFSDFWAAHSPNRNDHSQHANLPSHNTPEEVEALWLNEGQGGGGISRSKGTGDWSKGTRKGRWKYVARPTRCSSHHAWCTARYAARNVRYAARETRHATRYAQDVA